MLGRKPNQQALAFRSQVDLYFSAIAFARTPLNESPCFAARDERRHAMWLGLQALDNCSKAALVIVASPDRASMPP